MTGWLLIAWAVLWWVAAAGIAGEDAAAAPPLRIVTWNVQNGTDAGANGWPRRKPSLKAALEKEAPQILCVQEALPDQLAFLDEVLPEHGRAGVGRDDGKNAGEHCSIYYDRRRFKLLDHGTFWLSETPDRPGRCWGDHWNRVCTWVRLEDSGRVFRVFCVHFPLNGDARDRSVKLLLERIAAVPPGEPVMLAGDFNCGPGSGPWQALLDAGLRHAESASGAAKASLTWHLFGIPARCLDGIFVSKAWLVQDHKLLKDRVDGTYPSDHFGLSSDVVLGRE
jgi:endonuclease/exonuclease/phosphatase family metal-dependent hydrolase